MRALDSRAAMTTSRLLIVGAFLVVTLVTTAAFAQAVTGHLAAMHAPSADVAVVGYEVTDDDTLEVTLRVHNPTIEEFELGTARMNAYVEGDQVTDGTTSSFADVAVRPDETKRVTVPLGLREGVADSIRDADPGRIEIRGKLRVFVVDEMVYVPVAETEVSE